MASILLKNGMARYVASVAFLLWLVGVFSTDWALAQVNLTKHNLGGTQVGPDRRPAGITEVCVFCHTPFGSDISAAAPVWNRTLTPASTYTTYNSLGNSSLDGAGAPVGSVSIACLSCHDGVQAMNVMINTPQSVLADTSTGTNQMPGRLTEGGISSSGLDFRSDHPFGNQYGGGAIATDGPPVAPGVYRNTLMRDSDFNSAQSAILNGQTVWWVDTARGTAGVRDKTDMQLYTRVVAQRVSPTGMAIAGPVTRPAPFVECASCHDPHSAANSTFLRIENTGSAVCLACHSGK